MTGTLYSEETTRKVGTSQPCELTELVRGSERWLIDEMTPVVRRQDVSLDMSAVERIDAAGIAALISLYRLARESGHGFSVSNVAPHVRELLALVGLEAILVSRDTTRASHSGRRLARNAA